VSANGDHEQAPEVHLLRNIVEPATLALIVATLRMLAARFKMRAGEVERHAAPATLTDAHFEAGTIAGVMECAKTVDGIVAVLEGRKR
jgi:hypothetical protein